jgi:hypothetical protein
MKVKLPTAVSDAFKKAYPKAKIIGTSTEKENDKEMYEVESIDGKLNRDLLYLPDGTVFEIEEAVLAKDLPKEVKNALKDLFPKGKVQKSEKLMRGATIEYELVIKSEKNIHSVSIDPTGKVLKNEKKNPKKEKEDDEKEEKD